MSKKQPRLGSHVHFSCSAAFLSKFSECFENHRQNFQKSKLATLRRHVGEILSVRYFPCHLFLLRNSLKKLCIMFSGMQTFKYIPYICTLHDFMWRSDCNNWTFEWFYSNLYNNVILGMKLSPLAVFLPRKIVNTSLCLKNLFLYFLFV